MKIQNSQVAMEGNSYLLEVKRETTYAKVWASAESPPDKLSLSAKGLGLSKGDLQQGTSPATRLSDSLEDGNTVITNEAESSTEEKIKPEDWLTDKDLQKLQLLEDFLERLTGKAFKFKYFALADLKRKLEGTEAGFTAGLPQGGLPRLTAKVMKGEEAESVGWGVHLHQESFQYKKETVDFASAGQVTTADGRSISFNINYHLSQEAWSSTSVDFKAGDALIDPLVLRLNEGPLSYSEDQIAFDLDVDSKNEAFRVPVDNAGFLFFDRNGNQVADNGSELFGPTTGSGFGELKALDTDGNGWVDESDAGFEDLRIWIRSSDGSNRYLGLIEAGVGALFVGSVKTETGLYDNHRETIGKMSQTGIYLKESGEVSLIHEFDLKI